MCAWPGQLCKETTGIQAPPLAPFSLVSSSHREVPLVGAGAAARHERELRLLAAQALEQRALEAVPRERAARAREAEGLLKGGSGRFVLFWGRRRKGGRQVGEKRRPVRRQRRRRREGSVFSCACAPPASLIADEKRCCLSFSPLPLAPMLLLGLCRRPSATQPPPPPPLQQPDLAPPLQSALASAPLAGLEVLAAAGAGPSPLHRCMRTIAAPLPRAS